LSGEVYFRVDGGNAYSLGMGHVYRCLKTADCLKDKGVASVFIMKDIKGGIRKVEENVYPVIKLPLNLALPEEIDFLKERCSGQILVTDIRGINNSYFTQLNGYCSKTVYFDDLGQHDFSPHILINPAIDPNLQRFKHRYLSTRYLLGEKYFILGKGFKRRRNIRKTIKTAMVSLGGADPANYTPSVLRILDRLKYNFEIMLILGPVFENFKEVDDLCRKSTKRVHILRNVSNMGELMCAADIAFVSGGDTALELGYTGTPGFIVPTIKYESDTAAYLESRRTFVNLGDIKKKRKAETIEKIEDVWENFYMRKEFSRNAKRLIDCKGLLRIMHALDIGEN